MFFLTRLFQFGSSKCANESDALDFFMIHNSIHAFVKIMSFDRLPSKLGLIEHVSVVVVHLIVLVLNSHLCNDIPVVTEVHVF